MLGKKIYAVIPARSGSKGLKDKNIQKINRKELMAYSIEFAKKIDVDMVICSTDSKDYAKIAKKYGAEVPFLRSEFASRDEAMEEDILVDLYQNFDLFNIEYPDIFVWLRPTFVFRDYEKVKKCINFLLNNSDYSAMNIVVEAESRLYAVKDNKIHPTFNDYGKSMIRRQKVEKRYKIYNTDIFRGKPKNCSPNFLGNNVGFEVADKICGLDIDDIIDLEIVRCLIEKKVEIIHEYL